MAARDFEDLLQVGLHTIFAHFSTPDIYVIVRHPRIRGPPPRATQ